MVSVVVGAVAAPVLLNVWALNAVVDATAGVNGPNLIGRICFSNGKQGPKPLLYFDKPPCFFVTVTDSFDLVTLGGLINPLPAPASFLGAKRLSITP